MPHALIALGSNLGDRAAHLEHARDALTELPQTKLLAFSDIYETAPVGPAGQGAYLNAAASLDTALEPGTLLSHLRAIEQSAGRVRHERWGSRTLDLDLLLYDDCVMQTDDLTVPHPRMTERWFVLKPLADIAPDVVHPVACKTIAQLLDELDASP